MYIDAFSPKFYFAVANSEIATVRQPQDFLSVLSAFTRKLSFLFFNKNLVSA